MGEQRALFPRQGAVPRAGITLSIRQPWAWLIVQGYKDVENRTWQAGHRGLTHIHAAQKFDREGYEWVVSRRDRLGLPPALELPSVSSFRRGGIVGEADVVDCVEDHASPWFTGPNAFVLEKAVSKPIVECKGALGFFMFTPF